MKHLLYLYLLASLFLSSCIEAPKNARKTTSGSVTATTNTGSTTSSSTAPTFNSDEKLYWFSSTKTVGTITINKNSTNTYYLRGSYVHNFLNSKDASSVYYYNRQFCLVGNFGNLSYKQIRVRAIPMSTTSGKVTERMLRIDFPVESDNSSACAKTTIDSWAPASASYALNKICTTCTGKITTTNLKLLINNITYSRLDTIDASSLSTSGIQLQVDLDSNSTTETSSCTNSSCTAKGFDCCIEGQCVKDGTVKTNASSDPQYPQAVSEYTANPLSFINWPNIYNVCTNIAHSPPTSTDSNSSTANSLDTAEKRVQAYLSKWNCLNDVASSAGYGSCIGTTVSGSEAAYNEVRYSLAKSCGCTSTYEMMDVKCPSWTVKPLYKNSIQTPANIIDFYCYTPIPEPQVGAITNLNVSVSGRSAPHRFYSEAGDNYDSISGLSTSIKQEGSDFYYLDENAKTGPETDGFNFNSVIGRMVVDLSKAAPAKMVTVELGKTYILTTTSGYFTPCALCAKDSWFSSFFAHPPSQKGVGLQFSGYSTKRDQYESNDTLGNYEDTHFGRACFIPATMIPISHKKNATLQTQRLNRLKTQAAFYINGYQRDWFGFNKGALIGSFDGVTWFAIGNGRRITSTSTKLFLAYNSSFLDLATKTDTIVNIIPDSGNNTAPNVDYDPDLNLKDPLQGSAATCQRFHQCETDSECISQLGWEYVCADVSQLKTTWPIFDSNGNEIKNQEKNATIFDILSSTISTTYTKRCIYRGAGAPCKRDFTFFDSNSNPTYKKAFTCAPNFYCATTSSAKFNNKLVRSPNELDNILFGMDANVLGRPVNYVTAKESLDTEIRENIEYVGTTALSLGTSSNDLGMCRPGKGIISVHTEANMVLAHGSADAQKRTDYINQISSCYSGGTGDARVLSCPAIGSDNNYLDPSVNHTDKAREQNMCGGEAKHTSTFVSGFKSVESLSLGVINSVVLPTFVQDACLRRAGSVCHTDLDCGPNQMHETIAGSLNLAYFGGTEAERSFWAESLVCSQQTAIPAKNNNTYLAFDMTQNRCCREIGKDITMFTKGDTTFVPDNTGTGNTSLNTANFSIDAPTSQYRYSRYIISPSATYDPISGTVGTDLVPQVPLSTAGTINEPNQRQWMVVNETASKSCCGGGWIRKFSDGTHTWPIKSKLTLDTANFNCLNFRSPLPDSTFKATNPSLFYTGLSGSGTGPTAAKYLSSQSFSTEEERFCKAPQDGGCFQIPFKDNSNFTIYTPEPYFPGDKVYVQSENDPGYDVDDLSGTIFSRADTTPTQDPTETDTWTYHLNVDAPFAPNPFDNPFGFGKYNNEKTLNFFYSEDVGYSTHFYLPTYIGWDSTIGNPTFIQKVYIKYVYPTDTGKRPRVQDITAYLDSSSAECNAAIGYNSGTGLPADALVAAPLLPDAPKWCIWSHARTGNRPVMVVRADTTIGGTYDGWKYAGVIIDYRPVEFYRGTYTSNSPDNSVTVTGTKVTVPGNPLYYMSKLARLELLGIPQITYEPIYCNNNHDKLVPGIFKSVLTTRSDFSSLGHNYSGSFDPIEVYNADSSVNDAEQSYLVSATHSTHYGNYESKFVYQNRVDHDAVFSSKDFACCTPLGKSPKSGGATTCCSGYAVTKDNVTTCKLPPGTDLNVYFNKFVSSEGVGADMPGGGLTAEFDRDIDDDGTDELTVSQADENIDFNPFTGEPKLRDTTYQKLYTLGKAYCDGGKVSTGAIFGAFPPEPFSGSYESVSSEETNYPLSIADSILDSDKNDASLGKLMFDQGYRWNHHYYCAPKTN